jgi:hypothetical protein
MLPERVKKRILAAIINSPMYKHFYLERVGEASEIPARARAAGLFGAS